MKELLSFGGGVNSTALLIDMAARDPERFKALAIVFADTGGEISQTYAHVELFGRWLKARGQSIIHVRKDPSLEAYCIVEKVNPMRQWRWCTDKWKIRPINEWADKAIGKPRAHVLGIASDESYRAKPSPVDGIENRFPLVERGITRQGCERIIRDAALGWDVPKSGCFYCPLMPGSQFVELKKTHPDLFARAVAMEKNAGVPLKHKWLEDIVGCKDKQLGLFGLENECDSGHCFV